MSTVGRQPCFNLTIIGAEHELRVLAFTGKEAISAPYIFDLELVSPRFDLDLEAMLHQPAYLAFDALGHGVHGHISSIVLSSFGRQLARYRLRLEPRLAYLAYRTNHRIFQRLTVQQIIEALLEEHGILGNAYTFESFSSYTPREYCVQYGESDLRFIQRLCFEEGFHYHFRHSPDGHHLVFGDKQPAFTLLKQPTAYVLNEGMVAEAPSISHLELRLDTRTNCTVHRDYDFHQASHTLEAHSRSDLDEHVLENYTYPGRFTEIAQGQQQSQRALEHFQTGQRQASGRSDQPRLGSGHVVTVIEHPNVEFNIGWLLTEVHHQGKQPHLRRGGDGRRSWSARAPQGWSKCGDGCGGQPHPDGRRAASIDRSGGHLRQLPDLTRRCADTGAASGAAVTGRV